MGPAGKQPLDVVVGAAQVRLQAQTHVGVAVQLALVEVDRAVDVAAGLHVDPTRAAEFGAAIHEAFDVGGGDPRILVVAQLGELHRDLGVQAELLDAIEQAEVVPGGFGGLGQLGGVLAQPGEGRRGSCPRGHHAFGGSEGVLGALARA